MRAKAVLALLATVSAGCASTGGAHNVVRPPFDSDRIFTRAEVAPVQAPDAGSDDLTLDDLTIVRLAIEDALTRNGPFRPVVVDGDRSHGVLRVECRVTRYRGARPLLQAVSGFGRAEVEARCDFVDLSDGRSYAEAEFRADHQSGVGGPSEIEALARRLAEEIAEFADGGFGATGSR